jgi:hypothetical protein
MTRALVAAALVAIASPAVAQSTSMGLGISGLESTKDLDAARAKLGPAPPASDEPALEAWKARNYALRAEDDRRMASSYRQAIEQLSLIVPASAHGAAAEAARLKKIHELDWLVHGDDATALAAQANQEVADAYAETARLRATMNSSDKASQDLARVQARAKDLEQRLKTVEEINFEIPQTRIGAFMHGSLSSFLHDWTLPEAAKESPQGDLAHEGATGYGAEAAAAEGRPMLARDYLQDAIADVVAHANAAEEEIARAAPHPRPTMGDLGRATELARIESSAFAFIKAEVDAGRGQAKDLRSAEVHVLAARSAVRSLWDAANSMDAFEHRVFHARQLAEISTYQDHVRRVEAALPHLSRTDRTEAETALKRLRYDLDLHRRLDAWYQTHDPDPLPRSNGADKAGE